MVTIVALAINPALEGALLYDFLEMQRAFLSFTVFMPFNSIASYQLVIHISLIIKLNITTIVIIMIKLCAIWVIVKPSCWKTHTTSHKSRKSVTPRLCQTP